MIDIDIENNYDEIDENDENENYNDRTTPKESKSNLLQLTLDDYDNPEKKKRIIAHRPKFDTSVLLGERGIKMIPDAFKNFKLKGRNHEKEDLDKILSVYEHWGLRLFPKFVFEDIIEKIENLGQKREVKGALHTMRSRNIDQTNKINENNPIPNQEIIHTIQPVEKNMDLDMISWESIISDKAMHEDQHDVIDHNEEAYMEYLKTCDQAVQKCDEKLGISEERKKRIEENRLRALEKQRQKLSNTFDSIPNGISYEQDPSTSTSYHDYDTPIP